MKRANSPLPPGPPPGRGFCVRNWRHGLTLLMVALATCALAQDGSPDLEKLKNLSLEQIMQIEIPTVYGASKHEQKITDAPSSVTVVTREEIQAFGHRTLADILSSVRDLYVRYDRNYGYLGVRGFNRPGDFGGRVLILVDGRRMNDPIYDSAAIATDFPIDVDMIERVEVIRGPGSALYGNNAFFAVINVVTRTAADTGGLEASAEVGSYDTYKGRISYGHVFKSGLSVQLSASQYDSAGGNLFFKEFNQPVNNNGVAKNLDGDQFTSASLTASFEDFTLQGNYSSRHKNVPTASYGTIFNDPREFTIDQNGFARLAYAHNFEDDLTIQADVSWNSYVSIGQYPVAQDPAQPHQATINHDAADAQWWRAELQVSKQLFDTHHFTAGAEFQDNDLLRLTNYDTQPRNDYIHLRTSNETFGLYVQDEWAITSLLTISSGLRYDCFNTFGGTTNPRIGLIFHPREETTLKLLYGQAFRAPNVYENLFMADTNSSNPNLRPEHNESYEAALEQQLSQSLRLSASGFYSHITDLISQQLDTTTGKLVFENVMRADTKGGSVELEAKLAGGIKGRLSYTLQDTTDGTTGRRLSNSPEHLAKLGLIVPLFGDKLTSGFELQGSSAVTSTSNQRVGGFLLANWTLLSKQISKNMDVSLSIYNLFDSKYSYPGGPEHLENSILQDGRTFRLKIVYRF